MKTRKPRKLTEEKRNFILNNYKGMPLKMLCEKVSLSDPTVRKVLRQNNIAKRQFVSDIDEDKVKQFVKQYEGKLKIKELRIIFMKKTGLEVSESNFYRILSRIGFHYFGKDKLTRLFVDGNSDNLNPDNIILIPHTFRYEFRKGRLGYGLTGEALLTFIRLLELQSNVKQYPSYYELTNLNTDEVVECDDLDAVIKFLKCERNAIWKRKTIGVNGGKIIKGWEVLKKWRR